MWQEQANSPPPFPSFSSCFMGHVESLAGQVFVFGGRLFGLIYKYIYAYCLHSREPPRDVETPTSAIHVFLSCFPDWYGASYFTIGYLES